MTPLFAATATLAFLSSISITQTALLQRAMDFRSLEIRAIISSLVGAVAAGQRGYYSGSIGSCTKAGTIAVTIIAGPLNYMGINPKVDCTLPKPSK